MSDDRSLPVQARLRTSEFSVGELARLTGARPSAIRYYEACGLIPAPARRSGRRRYDGTAIQRVRQILAARRLGFSIVELKNLASTEANAWRREALSKARSLKALIAKLTADTAELEALSNCECASGGACHL